MNLLNLSMPIFLIICIGYISSKFNFFDKYLSEFLAKLLFYIIMPVTLFFDISRLPIQKTLVWNYMGAYFIASTVIIILSLIISSFFFKRDLTNLIMNAMASTHTNTAYLALPLFLMLFKNIAPVAAIIVVQVIFNFLILFGLDLSTRKKGRKINFYSAFLVIIESPILIGTLLGLLFSFFHLEISKIFYNLFIIISDSASFIALFALGLSLGASRLPLQTKQKVEVGTLLVLKTILHPIAAFLVGNYLFGVTGSLLTSLTLMAAMPTAKNLFIYSMRYQVGLERANIIVLVTTIISFFTISVILLTHQLL